MFAVMYDSTRSPQKFKQQLAAGSLILIGVLTALVPRLIVMRFEDVQLIAFPIVVLLMFFLGQNSKYKIPPVLLLLATGAYLVTTLLSRGVVSIAPNSSGIAVVRLNGDLSSARQQLLYRSYTTVAPIAHYPPISLLNRSFESLEEIRSLSDAEKLPPVVVTGNSQWLSVVSHVPYSFEKFADSEFSPWIAKHDGDFLKLQNHDATVSVFLRPRPFAVSLEPVDLTTHFLAQFTEGTVAGEELSDKKDHWKTLEALVRSEVDFGEAGTLEGTWKSPVARSAAQLMAGNAMLLQAFIGDRIELRTLRCAERQYFLALKRIRPHEDPSLMSALLNNLAVSRSFHVKSTRERKVLRRYLVAAMKLELRANGNSERVREIFGNLTELGLF